MCAKDVHNDSLSDVEPRGICPWTEFGDGAREPGSTFRQASERMRLDILMAHHYGKCLVGDRVWLESRWGRWEDGEIGVQIRAAYYGDHLSMV